MSQNVIPGSGFGDIMPYNYFIFFKAELSLLGRYYPLQFGRGGRPEQKAKKNSGLNRSFDKTGSS